MIQLFHHVCTHKVGLQNLRFELVSGLVGRSLLLNVWLSNLWFCFFAWSLLKLVQMLGIVLMLRSRLPAPRHVVDDDDDESEPVESHALVSVGCFRHYSF